METGRIRRLCGTFLTRLSTSIGGHIISLIQDKIGKLFVAAKGYCGYSININCRCTRNVIGNHRMLLVVLFVYQINLERRKP